MRMIAYQALLSRAENVERVQSVRRMIERAGGRVSMDTANVRGMTLVVVHLPERYSPEEFLPGLPFYPM